MPISDQVMRDLREVASTFTRAVRAEGVAVDPPLASARLVFRVLPALLDEVESLRDSTLAKDFLALYQSARSLVVGYQGMNNSLRAIARQLPGAGGVTAPDIEADHLALLVRRLAPLYDDVRLNLNAQFARRAWPVDMPSPLPLPGDVDPAHCVRVLQSDGTGRVECDHTFKGSTRCLHCGKHIDELMRERDAELARLQPQLPDGVLHATPEQLADIVQRQLAEHEGRGIINREAFDAFVDGHRVEVQGDTVTLRVATPVQGSTVELRDPVDDDLAIPITLGPSLRPRVEALVATGRLGWELPHVVQTLFVLGMLDAEGQDPAAHVGAPMMHVTADALFVRFGLPHEGDDDVTRQRTSILRQLLLDLFEWCDETDPLRRTFTAAIEALPR